MNIKQASFLTLSLIILGFIWVLLTTLAFKILKANPYPVYFPLIETGQFFVCFLPVIIFAKKRYEVNLKSQLNTFNPVIFFLLLVVTFLLFANILPFSQPIEFVKSISKGKLLYFQYRNLSFDGWILVNFINVVIFMPVFEEFLFRGIILKMLLTKYTPIFSIIASSLLFAIYHLNPIGIIYLIMYGLLLGWVYYFSKSLYLPVLLHIIINLLAFFTKDVNYDLNSKTLIVYVLFVSLSALLIILIIKHLQQKCLGQNEKLE